MKAKCSRLILNGNICPHIFSKKLYEACLLNLIRLKPENYQDN